MWVKAMRLDYYPQVDIRAVKPNPRKRWMKTSQNYTVLSWKRSNTALNRPICSPMTILGSGCMKSPPKPIKCVYRHRRRFKRHLKTDDEITNEDMIHINGDDLEQSEDTGERIGFSYMAQYRRYVYNPKLNSTQNHDFLCDFNG